MKYLVWAILCGVAIYFISGAYLILLAWYLNHKKATKEGQIAVEKISELLNWVIKC